MNYLFFDLETTGLARSSDILEFGAILCDSNLNPVHFFHEYFLADSPVPQSAVNIHGLTQQRLEFLASRDFISAASDIFDIVSKKDQYVCGHNIVSYDLNVLKSNLSRAGVSLSVDALKCIDTLQLARCKVSGSHKLDVLVAGLLRKKGLSLRDVNETFDNMIENAHLDITSEMRYHSALYDSFLSWCAYLQLT